MNKKNKDYSTDNIPMVGSMPPKIDGDNSNKSFIITNKRDKSNNTAIIIVIVICLLAICGCIYYYFTKVR